MHLFSPTEIYFCLWIHRTKFTKLIFKSIQMISENRNEGEIAKSRWLRRIEGDSKIQNISSSNSQNQFFETKMVQQWQCTCHIFTKIFTKFFLLITHYLLSKSPSLFTSFGLVYWFLCSRSLAFWLCEPGCLFLLWTCSCLSAFRSLCCSLDPPWFWVPGSPGWLELWNRMLWVTS